MTRVETTGLYHYEVTGEQETAAAEELTRKLDTISRDYHHGGSYITDAIAHTRQDIAEKYGVQITAVVG
jgi:pantothenate synthetase